MRWMWMHRTVIALLALAGALTACTLRFESDDETVEALPTPVVVAAPTATPALDPVTANVRRIYAVARVKGNRLDVFSKIGDSITVSDAFLMPIGDGLYDLGADYAHLETTIAYYSAAEARPGFGNAFRNPSLAAGTGWAAFQALDAAYASPGCLAGESPLACEYRVVQPSVALIMFGTNDIGYRTPDQYRADLDRIAEVSVGAGVIPILSTIPPRPTMPARVDEFNRIVAEVAAARRLPYWDYHAALAGLPNNGLAFDGVHPSSPPRRFADAAVFTPQNLRYGYVQRNLTALQTLHDLHQMIGDGRY
jgi:hypothetical protein